MQWGRYPSLFRNVSVCHCFSSVTIALVWIDGFHLLPWLPNTIVRMNDWVKEISQDPGYWWKRRGKQIWRQTRCFLTKIAFRHYQGFLVHGSPQRQIFS
jgi:hypothetical protein